MLPELDAARLPYVLHRFWHAVAAFGLPAVTVGLLEGLGSLQVAVRAGCSQMRTWATHAVLLLPPRVCSWWLAGGQAAGSGQVGVAARGPRHDVKRTRPRPRGQGHGQAHMPNTGRKAGS